MPLFAISSRSDDHGATNSHVRPNVFFFQKNSDADILVNKNQIKALKKTTFHIVTELMGIRPLDGSILGFKVSLQSSLVWALRELRLHQADAVEIELNIKLDGRPLYGGLKIICIHFSTKPMSFFFIVSLTVLTIGNV